MGHCSSCDRGKNSEDKVYLREAWDCHPFHWDPFLDGDPFLYCDDDCAASNGTQLLDVLQLRHWREAAVGFADVSHESSCRCSHCMLWQAAQAPYSGEELASLLKPADLGVPSAPISNGEEPVSTVSGACLTVKAKSAATGKAQPPGKGPLSRGKAPGRAPPPGKARPPAGPPSKAATPSCLAAASTQVGTEALAVAPMKSTPGSASSAPPIPPTWHGPQPASEWKARRLINWQPLREASRLQGSVWEQVNKEGFRPPPDKLLNSAFMENTCDDSAKTVPKPRQQRTPRLRRLSQHRALTADLLHTQLLRVGVQSPSQVCRALGKGAPSQHSIDVAAGVTQQALPEEALEPLLSLLELACGQEDRLCEVEAVHGQEIALVPAEAFLRETLREAGPVQALHLRTELALQISRFPFEVASARQQLEVGLLTVETLMQSSVMPKLLQGVLFLGNYVNARCDALNGAIGVTLESLVKISHTRCNIGGEKQGLKQHNALHFLIRHLQQDHPCFLERLSAELECCRKARDLDPKALAETVQTLVGRVDRIQRMAAAGDGTAKEDLNKEGLLHPDRLQQFLRHAKPSLEELLQGSADLDNAVVSLRRWFAEPPSNSFIDMMQNLAELRDVLPPIKSLPSLSRSSRRSGASVRRLCRAHSAPPASRQTELCAMKGSTRSSLHKDFMK